MEVVVDHGFTLGGEEGEDVAAVDGAGVEEVQRPVEAAGADVADGGAALQAGQQLAVVRPIGGGHGGALGHLQRLVDALLGQQLVHLIVHGPLKATTRTTTDSQTDVPGPARRRGVERTGRRRWRRRFGRRRRPSSARWPAPDSACASGRRSCRPIAGRKRCRLS